MNKQLLLIFLCAAIVLAQNDFQPGAKAFVKDDGLNTLAKDMIPLFIKTMTTLDIPNLDGVRCSAVSNNNCRCKTSQFLATLIMPFQTSRLVTLLWIRLVLLHSPLIKLH